MIDGWRHADFRECVEEIRSGKSVNSIEESANSDQIGVLKTSCVYNGRFEPRENKLVIPEEQSLVKCPVTAGTIIVSRMNTVDLVGASGYVDQNYPNIFLPDRLWAVSPKQGIDPVWLYYVTSSPEIRARLSDNASGTSASMKNISQDVFLSMPARIPPLPEQRKIAEILRTWDEAIEKLEALQAVKLRRLEALRDALLLNGLQVGKTRKKRPIRRIGEVTHELTARNGDGALRRDVVMGVTNSRGIVPMREQTVADDIGRYKKLPPYAFAYNPMRINVGSIAMNADKTTVLVSPDYVVFACNQDGMEPDYLDHLRQTRWWLHHMNSGGSGSVRQRTYYDDLAALQLPLPDIAEQKAIITILNLAKLDVTRSIEIAERLISQKRGLMQKLLTGEWRVNLNRSGTINEANE